MQLRRKRVGHNREDVLVLGACCGEKPEVTIGQAENWDLAIPHDARGAQERSVAAERDDKATVHEVGGGLDAGALIGGPFDLKAGA